MNTIQPPPCDYCRTTLVQRNGQKGIFYACPNWKSDGSGCTGMTWNPPRGTSAGRNGVPRYPSTTNAPYPPQNAPQGQNTGTKNAAVEMIYELQAIRSILERIEIALAEKDIQKSHSSQDGWNTFKDVAQKRNVEQNGEPPEEWMNM